MYLCHQLGYHWKVPELPPQRVPEVVQPIASREPHTQQLGTQIDQLSCGLIEAKILTPCSLVETYSLKEF